MLTQYVHPRLGLPKFLTFEPYFVAALRAFDAGRDTKFEITGGLSPTTVAARMRDSLQGYRINKQAWKDRVDPVFIELFAKHDNAFVISGPNEQGEVWLRQRQKKGGHMKSETPFSSVEGNLPKYVASREVVRPTAPAAPVNQSLTAKDCGRETVESFVTLKRLGQLDMPVIFPGPVDPNLCDHLSSVADVAFHFDPQRNETILI